MCKANRRRFEFLTNESQRGSGCFANAECEMARLPAHRNNDVPTAGRTRIFHQALNKFHSDMTRRLKSKSRNVLREWQIVIDGLGNVNGANLSIRCECNRAR